jgi:hypothetical protein
LPTHPIIDFFANVIRRKTVAWLNPVLKPVTPPVDEFQIVVSEFVPLFLDLAFGLLPVSFTSLIGAAFHCPTVSRRTRIHSPSSRRCNLPEAH